MIKRRIVIEWCPACHDDTRHKVIWEYGEKESWVHGKCKVCDKVNIAMLWENFESKYCGETLKSYLKNQRCLE